MENQLIQVELWWAVCIQAEKVPMENGLNLEDWLVTYWQPSVAIIAATETAGDQNGLLKPHSGRTKDQRQ